MIYVYLISTDVPCAIVVLTCGNDECTVVNVDGWRSKRLPDILLPTYVKTVYLDSGTPLEADVSVVHRASTEPVDVYARALIHNFTGTRADADALFVKITNSGITCPPYDSTYLDVYGRYRFTRSLRDILDDPDSYTMCRNEKLLCYLSDEALKLLAPHAYLPDTSHAEFRPMLLRNIYTGRSHASKSFDAQMERLYNGMSHASITRTIMSYNDADLHIASERFFNAKCAPELIPELRRICKWNDLRALELRHVLPFIGEQKCSTSWHSPGPREIGKLIPDESPAFWQYLHKKDWPDVMMYLRNRCARSVVDVEEPVCEDWRFRSTPYTHHTEVSIPTDGVVITGSRGGDFSNDYLKSIRTSTVPDFEVSGKRMDLHMICKGFE